MNLCLFSAGQRKFALEMLSNTLRILAPAIALAAGILGLAAITVIMIDPVGFTYLLGFPALAGFIIMWFRPKNSLKTFGKSIAWLLFVMLLSLLGSLVSGLEGLICITMALIPILFGTLLGGVLYLSYDRWKTFSKSTLSAASLPVLAIVLLDMLPTGPTVYEISDSILIDAPPAVVFQMLKSIPDISPDEIPTRSSHLLGVPKPTAAVWEESSDGAVRHSHWGDDIHFLERITAYEPDRRIAWDFEFPDGWAPEDIEDPHVKVGGQHFDVLRGAYVLEDHGGKTRLSLTTWTYDGSGMGAYAEFWHNFFFDDFHDVILELVKARTERSLAG
ncbi:polyketide cyclase/dehydrase [Tritonibacter scottomollicae]